MVPGERAKDWHDHRAGMLTALAPVGSLETELADRAATLLWRLRRVTTFETNVSAAGVESVVANARAADAEPTPDPLLFDPPRTRATIRKELTIARETAECHAATRDLFRRLEAAPPDESVSGEDAVHLLIEATEFAFEDDEPDEDEDFYTRLGIPPDFGDNPEEWDGWTVLLVLKGLTSIAEDAGLTLKVLLSRAVLRSGASAIVSSRRLADLDAELAALEAHQKASDRVAQANAVLPDAAALDKIMRYEAHLNKQLTQTLHILERLQAARAGVPVVPPLALDMTVNDASFILNPAS